MIAEEERTKLIIPEVQEDSSFPFSLARQGEMECTDWEYSPDGFARALYKQGDQMYQRLMRINGNTVISFEEFQTPHSSLIVASRGTTVSGENYNPDLDLLQRTYPNTFRINPKRQQIPLEGREGLFYSSGGINQTEGYPVVIHEQIVSYKQLAVFNGTPEFEKVVHYEGISRLNFYPKK